MVIVFECNFPRSSMTWTEEKDLMMLREMAAEGVMHHKPKSGDRGSSWQKVADNLNPLPQFEINTRSVRDRFNILAKKHKVKMAKEERSTGGGGEELSELENLLEELIEIGEETDQKVEEEAVTRKNVIEEDREKALEMRKRAMESMGETRERNGADNRGGKRRRSASQSLEILYHAIKTKQEMMEQERKERQEERRQQQEQREQMMQQWQLCQQQQQQQQQQQSQQFAMVHNCMMQMMEQQQRQTDMILELFRNSNK